MNTNCDRHAAGPFTRIFFQCDGSRIQVMRYKHRQGVCEKGDQIDVLSPCHLPEYGMETWRVLVEGCKE